MKVIRWIDKNLEEALMVLLLFGIAAVMILQVVSRYVFNYSMSWSDELVRYFLVWSCFLSVSFCVKNRISIKIESVLHALPERIRPWLRAVRHLIVLIFCIVMIPFAVTYIRQAVASGATSAAMQIPMYYIQSAPLVGFVLLAIRCLQALVRELKIGIRGPATAADGSVISSSDDGFVQDIIEINVEEDQVLSAVNEVREELGEEPLPAGEHLSAVVEEAAEGHAVRHDASAEQAEKQTPGSAAEEAVEKAPESAAAEDVAEKMPESAAAEEAAGKMPESAAAEDAAEKAPESAAAEETAGKAAGKGGDEE